MIGRILFILLSYFYLDSSFRESFDCLAQYRDEGFMELCYDFITEECL